MAILGRSRNSIIITTLLFFITMEVLIVFDFLSRREASQKESQAIHESLFTLQQHLGYVGLIHHFKNYLVRGDLIYKERALKEQAMALSQLEYLEVKSQELVGELTPFTNTRTMIQAYTNSLEVITQLRSQNASVVEIDDAVRFDDAPSYREIEKLGTHLKTQLELLQDAALRRSFVFALIVFACLIGSLVALVRFYLGEHRSSLDKSLKLNAVLSKHQARVTQSQAMLLSVMEDMEVERDKANRLNKELNRKNKEMEQFIYTVSHDLKSPLVTIAGFSQGLERELSEHLNDKQRRRFERIHQNIRDMDGLLADLLDISRLVQRKIENSEVDIGRIIERLRTTLEGDIVRAEATITVHEPLFTVWGNERLLTQAMQNLLTNALKYKHPERPAKIDITTELIDGWTHIRVQDNGLGIDPKYQDRIFGIFERLSTNTEGSGVGLTIVKTIVERLGGVICLKSEVDVGSCFTLVLYPARKPVTEGKINGKVENPHHSDG